MNNGFNLVRLQPKQLLKTGDTMTGNLTMAGGSKVIGNLIGNADTATKLQTQRAINGTNFDGTKPITTAQWGQARNINIASSDGTGGGTTVSINGSTNYTLRLPDRIKASLLGNATTASTLQSQRRITINGVVQTFDGSSDINFTIPTGGNYLPLTGGTVTGLTSFTKGIQSGTSVNWKILETGVATFPGVNVHNDLVVSGTVSGKGSVGGADTWTITNNGDAKFNGTIRGKGDSLHLSRGAILLPQGGNTQRECDYIRLGEMFMAGLSSIHFVTVDGNRGVVYAGNFNMSYRSNINSRSAKKINSVFDIINSVDVIEDEESYKLVNKEDDNSRNVPIDNKCVRKISDDENVSEDETTVDMLSTISLLWKSNQELIEENNKLNERLSKIENKLSI